MFTVYVLKSLKNGRLYTGSTNDLERRLVEHNSGKSKYTKSTAPFELLYTEEYPTRIEAYSREMFFKTGKGREILKNLLNIAGVVHR
jgi:putative endonuclease